MNIRHTLIVGVLPFISFAALAADTGTLSREAVKTSVISARAAHQLRPAGDAADFAAVPDTSMTWTQTRQDVNAQVREARAHNELRPTGETESYAAYPGPFTSDRSRPDVKAEVLEARRTGELIPAGEGLARNVDATPASAASFQKLASALRKLRPVQ